MSGARQRQRAKGRTKTAPRRPSKRAAGIRAAKRRRIAAAVAGIAAVAAAIALLSGGGSGPSPTAVATDVSTATVTGPPGPEGIPQQTGAPLAGLPASPDGRTVDGIQCNAMEQVAYHIHAHLAVFVDGTLRPIPGGIGIVTPVAERTNEGTLYAATDCYDWLHTHAQDGIIHVESPTQTSYTLGQSFAIWGQPLSSSAVGPAEGPLTIFVNGTAYQADPADIGLAPHEDIQIDVGSPATPPEKVDWSGTRL